MSRQTKYRLVSLIESDSGVEQVVLKDLPLNTPLMFVRTKRQSIYIKNLRKKITHASVESEEQMKLL